jgi:hypothetical protein
MLIFLQNLNLNSELSITGAVQDSACVPDGSREVRRLRALVAAHVRRGEARARRVPLAPKHNGKSSRRSIPL